MLHGNVELKENHGATTDFEVVSIGREIQRWNRDVSAEGACCTQSLEVGDRIVSVSGVMDVGSQLGVKSPALLIVRFRAARQVDTQQIEVKMRRNGPYESWGIQMRTRVSEPKQLEVLDIVERTESGAPCMLAKWNGTAHTRVCRGDRIVSANGVRDPKGIEAQMLQNDLTLIFERW